MIGKTAKIFQPNTNAHEAAQYRHMGLNASDDQAEPLAVLPPVDAAAGREAVREKLTDAATPGYQAEFDPEEAERAGAFVEDALSEQDAAESGDDLAALASQGDDEAPAFITEGGPSDDIPPFVNTTNIRELYDWKPGESLDEAIARKKAQEGYHTTMNTL